MSYRAVVQIGCYALRQLREQEEEGMLVFSTFVTEN